MEKAEEKKKKAEEKKREKAEGKKIGNKPNKGEILLPPKCLAQRFMMKIFFVRVALTQMYPHFCILSNLLLF